jgi:glycosyltransferase involved in cell wall biosynthesis
MREDYRIYVFTSDRDLGSPKPYENIKTDEWISVDGNVQVFYCSPQQLGWKNVKTQLSAIQPDLIYLNSMFSTRFTIFPLLIQRLYGINSKVILSPRGMLRASAVQFKSFKKRVFLKGFRWLGFHKRIYFLASDDTELKDTRRYFGAASRVVSIPNFPAALPQAAAFPEKKTGECSFIYIGRIHPIKNLDYLLKILGELTVRVSLTIAGSIEDKMFWQGCQEIIQGLPENVSVVYAGEMPNHQLQGITARHHIFVLPTKGENFGHAIFEALALGRPVLISDQTPWRGLEAAKAGWDLSLDRPDRFRQAIEEAAAFSQQEYEARCRTTRKYIENYIAGLDLKEEYKKLFC